MSTTPKFHVPSNSFTQAGNVFSNISKKLLPPKLFASSISGKSTPLPKPTPASKIKKRNLKDTGINARIQAWKEKIRAANFYFDGVDPRRVEQFLSLNVTHIVTANPALDTNLDEAQKAKFKDDEIAVTDLASKLRVAVWHISKLVKLFELIVPVERTEKLMNLEEALSREKKFGISTHCDEKQAFQPFVGPFILVEELSGAYKPIIAREYQDVPYPKLYFKEHSSRTVFAPKSSEVEERKHDTTVEDKESDRIEDDINPPPSIASGIVDLTTAPVVRQPLANVSIQQLNARIPKPFDSKKRERTTENEKPRKKLKRSRGNVCGMAFYSRSGYCENCNIKYEHYNEHINSKIHKRWACNEFNFRVLDNFMNTACRELKVCQHQSLSVKDIMNKELYQNEESSSNPFIEPIQESSNIVLSEAHISSSKLYENKIIEINQDVDLNVQGLETSPCRPRVVDEIKQIDHVDHEHDIVLEKEIDNESPKKHLDVQEIDNHQVEENHDQVQEETNILDSKETIELESVNLTNPNTETANQKSLLKIFENASNSFGTERDFNIIELLDNKEKCPKTPKNNKFFASLMEIGMEPTSPDISILSHCFTPKTTQTFMDEKKPISSPRFHSYTK